MSISHTLKIWAFIALLAVASSANCPAKNCRPRQLGTHEYVTRLLQCSGNGQSCLKAIFDPSPNIICLMRFGDGSIRIYLHNCPNFDINTGYFITDTADVLPSRKGLFEPHAVFYDTACPSNCQNIERAMYQANGWILTSYGTQAVISSDVQCQRALYIYPDDHPKQCGQTGPTGPTGQQGNFSVPFKRPCPSQTRQRVLLTITDGESVFAIGPPERNSMESYRLPIVKQLNGEVFYAQEYSSRAVGANGTIELVTAFTLQLVKSKKYLVADVLDDTTLNYTGPHSSGLNLKNDSEFPGGYAREPDYRFFVQYSVTIYNETATVFCPLFHRNHCLYPGASGFLRLTPVKYSDRSPEPTFVNPTDDVLRHFILYSRSTESGRWWQVKLSIL